MDNDEWCDDPDYDEWRNGERPNSLGLDYNGDPWDDIPDHEERDMKHNYRKTTETKEVITFEIEDIEAEIGRLLVERLGLDWKPNGTVITWHASRDMTTGLTLSNSELNIVDEEKTL